MTTVNYLRITKAVEDAEKKLGGPLRESLHARLNEPGETVASISKEISVKKPPSTIGWPNSASTTAE